MYAAVPRIIPACVIAGVVIVGDIDTLGDGTRRWIQRPGQPKVEHFDGAVITDFDIGGLQVAMDDPLLVRGFEGLGDLLGDGQGLGDRDSPARDALGEILALDQFHHKGTHTAGLFEAVNVRDVRMVQRGEGLGFACESGESVGVVRERVRQDFHRDIAIEPGVGRPVDLRPSRLRLSAR